MDDYGTSTIHRSIFREIADFATLRIFELVQRRVIDDTIQSKLGGGFIVQHWIVDQARNGRHSAHEPGKDWRRLWWFGIRKPSCSASFINITNPNTSSIFIRPAVGCMWATHSM